MEVLVAYGTRPEAIKLAPVVLALSKSERMNVRVLSTGQHREMLDQVNGLFGIRPERDLDVMVHGGSLNVLLERTIGRSAQALTNPRPDAVVVQGDTTTAFAVALAAFYERIPVVHVEAGLRTHDLTSPFPEEGNRQLISRIAALHLAPTSQSARNLLREGIDPRDIAITGNTVIDALEFAVTKTPRFEDPRIEKLVAGSDAYILVTTHRRESWGTPMREAMLAVRDVSREHPELHWLVPMHRNRVVRDVIREVLGGEARVILTEPLDYHAFTHAMRAALIVVTDSGGVQEEAPSLGRPVLVLRNNTERPEAVDAGTVRLVGTRRERVVAALEELITDEGAYSQMANAVNPYGDGMAASRSRSAIEELLGVGRRAADFAP